MVVQIILAFRLAELVALGGRFATTVWVFSVCRFFAGVGALLPFLGVRPVFRPRRPGPLRTRRHWEPGLSSLAGGSVCPGSGHLQSNGRSCCLTFTQAVALAQVEVRAVLAPVFQGHEQTVLQAESRLVATTFPFYF